LTLPQLYAVAGTRATGGDSNKKEVVLKIVNVGDQSVPTTIHVDGAASAKPPRVVTLSGDPEAVNTLDDPDHVAPKPAEATVSQGAVNCQLPANSLTILTIPAP